MYPYISREDCYYTDTDSVVLGHPLPSDVISSSVLGMFKLEDRILKGYFLAPKSYSYIPIDGEGVLKYKGPAKSLVTQEWFESQYAEPTRTEHVMVTSNFRVDWHTLNIIKKETLVRLGLKLENKRKPVFINDIWLDTEPIEIKDFPCLNHVGKLIMELLLRKRKQLQIENEMLKTKEGLNGDEE